MTKPNVVFELTSGFVVSFLITWSPATQPTFEALKKAAKQHVPLIPEETFTALFGNMLKSRMVVLDTVTGLLRLNRSRLVRLRLTPNRAVGFVLGGLAASYSPITQVGYLRLLLEKIWSGAEARQALYDVVIRLRREGHVVSSTWGDDVEQWYLSLPKDAAALDALLPRQ